MVVEHLGVGGAPLCLEKIDMAIDTKELRRLAQAALIGPDGISVRWLKHLKDFREEATPSEVLEILDCLEAAEKEVESLRQGIALRDDVVAALAALAMERDALRAKVERMEQQEPVAEWLPLDSGEDTRRD